MTSSYESKYLARCPENARQALAAFFAKRGALVAAVKNVRGLANLWEEILCENAEQYCETLTIEDVRFYNPSLVEGERPLPALEEWELTGEMDEVIGWDKKSIVFASIRNGECHIAKRMQSKEMLELIRRAANLSGWTLFEQTNRPEDNVVVIDQTTSEIKFIGSQIAGVSWAYPICQMADEVEENRTLIAIEKHMEQCAGTHTLHTGLAALIGSEEIPPAFRDPEIAPSEDYNESNEILGDDYSGRVEAWTPTAILMHWSWRHLHWNEIIARPAVIIEP